MHLSKLNEFADENLNLTIITEFLFHRIENIVGNIINARYRNFLLLPQCFLGPLPLGL